MQLTGESRNTGGRIQRQDIEITAPSGDEVALRDFTADGTFDVTVDAADFGAGDAEVGTYTVVAFGFVAEDARSTTTFTVTAAPVIPPASITVTPTTITPDAFLATGVQATGRTFDNGGPINRSNLVLTSPSGETASYFDLTGDGTFNVNIKPKGDVLVQPLEQGTYTLTATSLLQPSYTATTTFVVQGEETQPPATIAVTPTTITPAAFLATGVQTSGRTFDSGSDVNIERTDITLTAPNGTTAAYFDLTSDGTFNVNIKPKGAISTNPVAEGTYTLTATSLQDPTYTATTTFVVAAPVDPPVDRDPEVTADPTRITVSDFTELGVNLSGFTEDTPGPLTRQEIFVTSPSGVGTNCADFTGDGTFDVQVYPGDAPAQGPEG